MSAKGVIVIVFLMLLLGGIFAIAYFFYEKPIQENAKPTFYNITIRTIEKESMKSVSTGIVITLDESNIVYWNGTSVSNGYILIQIPTNRTFAIHNFNVKNEQYYRDYIVSQDITKDIIRFDMMLTNYSSVSFEKIGTFGNHPLFITISSPGVFRNMHICFDHSSRVINARLNEDEVDIPARLKNKVNHCYDINRTLEMSSVTIEILYSTFGVLDSEDYIKMYVLDADECNFDKNLVVECNGQDIGAKDFLYIIKNL